MHTETTNNIALFDMDVSLADYDGALVKDLNALRSPEEPVVTSESLWNGEKLPHISARMSVIKHQPGWWFNLNPIEIGMDVLDICRRFGFDIHILTKGPKKHSQAWDEKVRWCQKYIDADVDIHVTSDKGLVYGKILYDDYPDYMLRWLEHRPRGLGIMPVTPGNKNFVHPNVIKYNGIEDMEKVIKVIKLAKDRQAGQRVDYSVVEIRQRTTTN